MLKSRLSTGYDFQGGRGCKLRTAHRLAPGVLPAGCILERVCIIVPSHHHVVLNKN